MLVYSFYISSISIKSSNAKIIKCIGGGNDLFDEESVNDLLNDDVISFTYDDMSGVESKTINSDFKVEKANFYTNYNIASDTEKYNILSDTISSINSRNIILVNNSIQKSNESKAVINDFTFTYEADNLGRLSSVKGNQINELNALIKVEPIKWRVLSVDLTNGEVYAIAENVVDINQFDDGNASKKIIKLLINN